MSRHDSDEEWDLFLANLFFYGGVFCLLLFAGVWLLIGSAHALWFLVAGVLALVVRLYLR